MYTFVEMFVSKFDYLRRKKSFDEQRDLPLTTVATETGLSFGTVQRVSSGKIGNVSMASLAALCRYFAVKSIAELVEYVPDDKSDTSPKTPSSDRETGNRSGE